jgi:hypothetical protein
MVYLLNSENQKRRVSLSPEVKLEFLKSIGLKPKNTQRHLLECCGRFVVLIAGSRYGKSFVLAMEVASELVLLPQITKKPLTWWIASPTEDLGMLEFDYIYDNLIASGFQPVIATVRKPTGDQGYIFKSTSPRPTITIVYPRSWGVRDPNNKISPGKSIVQVRTGKRGHEHNYLGREVDGVIFSECAQFTNLKFILEHRIFRAVTTRLGRLLFATTPSGLGYLKDEIFAWGIEGEKKSDGWHSLGPYSSIEGNMSLEEFNFWKKQLGENNPGFQEQYLGLFTRRSGRVYPDFIPDSKHIYNESDEKQFFSRSKYCNHEILIGLDFGWENPSAVVFTAKIGERYFVFDEIYGSHIPTTELASQIKEKLEYWGIEDYTAYSDIDWQINHTLEQEGIFCQPARKHDKFSRHEYIRQQFRVNLQTGYANIMFHERCRYSIKEHLDYSVKEQIREDVNLTESPIEKDNHTCDALSYLVWTPQYHLWSSKVLEKM